MRGLFMHWQNIDTTPTNLTNLTKRLRELEQLCRDQCMMETAEGIGATCNQFEQEHPHIRVSNYQYSLINQLSKQCPELNEYWQQCKLIATSE